MITDQLVQAFSWTLIHSLWQGLLLSVITGGVLMVTKRSASVIRYNLILLQLLLFITGCAFTFAWEWQQHRLQPVDFLHLQADNIKQYTQTIVSYFSANAPVVLLLWFVLFIARAVKMMGGLVYLRRARYKNIYSPEDYWKNKIVLLCEQLQIKKAVTLFESGYVKMPLVIGHFKPVILMPVGLLSGLPASQVEAVLLHELAHIRRNDYCINLLQNITEALFFFNPGLLWISSLLREEREHCCDDIALAQTNNKRAFIEALISFKEHSNNYVVAFPGKKNHLLQRVSRIVHNKNNTLNPIEKVFFMTGILVLAVIMTAAGVMQVRTIVKEEHTIQEQRPVQKPVVAKHKKIKQVQPAITAEEKEQVVLDKEEILDDQEQEVRDKELFIREKEQAREQSIHNNELFIREKEHAREQSIHNKEPFIREKEQAREQSIHDKEPFIREKEQAREQSIHDKEQFNRDEKQFNREKEQFNREKEQAREQSIHDKEQFNREKEQAREQSIHDKEQFNREKEQAREQSIHDKQQAQRDRDQAVKDREQAVKDRVQADKDRMQAQRDRAQADRDRAQADKDREQARRDKEQAQRDRLQADKEKEQAMRDKQPQ